MQADRAEPPVPAEADVGAARHLPLLVGAFLSGAASLCYEVVWSRALVVPLGNSSDAAALVLCGFMLGMAVGAWLGGRLSERVRSPLRLYAMLEAVLAPYGVVAPSLFAALASIGAGASGVPVGWALRHVLAIGLVVVPCLATGATFPLLVRAMTVEPASIRTRVGIAYATNTAGAAAGAVATGFWALPWIGLRACSASAAVMQLVAAAFVLVAHQRSPRRSVAPPPRDGDDWRGDRIALASAFVGGFAMLACEALWARVLTFVFGHDTYAFSALLAVVLIGLSLGALLHRWACRAAERRLLGWFGAAFAISVLTSFWLASSAVVRGGRDPFHIDSFGSAAASVSIELYRELAFAPLLVLAPSIFAGAVYASACSAYGRRRSDTGRSTGVVALVNGLGSALGVLTYAFGIVPWLGIQRAFVAIACLGALLAGACFLPSRARKETRGRALGTAAVPLLTVLLIAWAMPGALPRSMLLEAVGARHQTLLFYEEARTATISVISNRINAERQLVINAVNEVTTRLVHDQSFKLLGHLGPLLHPEPRRAVMICLGAGLSAGAALTHAIERLDVVDLSSAVARGARQFEAENHAALDDPRLRLHIDDGRQFLLNARVPYDVAIIDSTHPKAVDSWILYTKEFYELVRARLEDRGVVVQWLPLHGLSEREFRIVVRTFLEVFPDMTLWANAGFETYGQVGYAKLVGFRRSGELQVDYARLRERLAEPRIRADLEPFGMDRPEEVLDLFVAGNRALARWTEGLPIQSDDHPLLPYATRYSNGPRMTPGSLLAVREPLGPRLFVEGPSAEQVRSEVALAEEIQGLVLAGRLDRAAALSPGATKVPRFAAETDKTRDYYVHLADLYPDHPNKLFESASQLASLGYADDAHAIYDRGLALRPRDVRLRLGLALTLSEQGDHARAVSILSALHVEVPSSALVQYDLGAALLAAGEAEAAASHLRAAAAADTELVGAALAVGEAEARIGNLPRAKTVFEALVQREPWSAEAYEWLGRIEEQRGAHTAAVEPLRRATRLHPYRGSYHYRLAVALHHLHEPADAEAEFVAALRLDPDDVPSLIGLGRTYLERGIFDRATDTFVRALEKSPNDARTAMLLGEALRGEALRGGGDMARAVGAYCLAARLHANDPEARARLVELGTRPERCGESQADPSVAATDGAR